MIIVKFITESFDLLLHIHKFSRSHIHNIFLQKSLLFVLSFFNLPGLLKLPFFFAYEGIEHVTLARCEVQIRRGVLRSLCHRLMKSRINFGSSMSGTALPLALAALCCMSLMILASYSSSASLSSDGT